MARKQEGIDWRITTSYDKGTTLTVPTAWELTIDGDTATCVNCMLMLSTVTVMAAGDQMQLTCDLTGHTDGWLCGVIKGSTKEVSLDFRDPTTEMNEEQDEIVFPLYRVIKKDDVWRVAVDVRAMPRIGAYCRAPRGARELKRRSALSAPPMIRRRFAGLPSAVRNRQPEPC